MEHSSKATMATFSNWKNLPTEASASSSGRPCYLFGVEISASNPVVNNGNEQAAAHDARREGKRVASEPVVPAVPRTAQLLEAASKGKQQMIGSASGSINKAKATKKNGGFFPKDTKALLSTGIFNGIFVSYGGGAAKEKHRRLFAMIQGNKFLCACFNCNGREYVSARKLEHHADYETKHPNSGIYFGSGLSIFQTVEKLQKTPRNKLFETIHTITGSRIHEGNFKEWRASYLAELAANDDKAQENMLMLRGGNLRIA